MVEQMIFEISDEQQKKIDEWLDIILPKILDKQRESLKCEEPIDFEFLTKGGKR